MIDKETKIVKLSIVVLSFALIFIYVLWFYVKGSHLSDLKEDEQTISTWTAIRSSSSWEKENKEKQDKEHKGYIEEKVEGNVKEKKQQEPEDGKKQEDNEMILPSLGVKEENSEKDSENHGEEFIPSTVPERKILSWTTIYDERLPIIEQLHINYRYALKDNKDITFLYLGEGLNNDLVEIANTAKWTIYTLDTEYDIKKNALFGDRILFLNIPEYHNKIVLMVVKYKNNYWLIMMDYTIYHQSKPYLKSLFIE